VTALPEEEMMSLGFDVFAVAPKPIPSAVPGFEKAVGPATWPPSTSTLISDDDGALLVDCLITEQEGRQLAAWVKSHDRELRYVYITHPHADHFLGLPEILAAISPVPALTFLVHAPPLVAFAVLGATFLVALCAIMLPYSPLANLFGFVPLPISYLVVVVIIAGLYMLSAEYTKRLFYRWELKLVRNLPGH